MEIGVRHLSDKNQSIVLRTEMINWAVSQKHSSLEKEGMVIPHQATSQVKTDFVSAHTWFCYSNYQRYKEIFKSIQNCFVSAAFLGQVWREDYDIWRYSLLCSVLAPNEGISQLPAQVAAALNTVQCNVQYTRGPVWLFRQHCHTTVGCRAVNSLFNFRNPCLNTSESSHPPIMKSTAAYHHLHLITST